MLRLLPPAVHGALDYLLALTLLVAPELIELAYPAAPIARLTGGIYLGVSLLTRYPLGVLHLIPFPIHAVIEAAFAAVWLMAPWLFKFAHDPAARNLYLASGAALLLVIALSDYRSTAPRSWQHEERRHNLVDRRARAVLARPDRRLGTADRRRYSAA